MSSPDPRLTPADPPAGGGTGATDDAARRARRAFVRAHHPDVGGDPDQFAAGLARFAAGTTEPDPATAPPTVTVLRGRGIGPSLVRSVRGIRRRLAGRPPRRLL